MILLNFQSLHQNKWSKSSLNSVNFIKLAEKYIVKYGGSQKFRMLRDPDAIDFVSSFLMISAVNFLGNKGWSLRSYLGRYGKHAIQKWKYRKINDRKFKKLNEDSRAYYDNQLENLIRKEEQNTLKTMMKFASPILQDYYNRLTIKEMSVKYNTTLQNIYNRIQYDIKKLKQLSKM